MIKTLLLVVGSILATLFVTQDPKPDGETQNPLSPIASLIGAFEGKGKGPMGTYRENLTGEWAADGKLLLLRSKSRIASQTVFEDLRVFVHDGENGRVRMHQFTSGTWTAYDVTASPQSIVMTETHREGVKTDPWRYTYTLSKTGELIYQLHTKSGDEHTLFVSGALKKL